MEDHEKDLHPPSHAPFFLGGARIDPPALRIELDGSSQRVEAKVMEVLLVLSRVPGQVVSRRDLEREVWSGRVVTDDAVTNAVVKLRKALHDSPRQPRVIETIAKSGYRLMVEPEMAEATPTGVFGAPRAVTAIGRPVWFRALLWGVLLSAVVSTVAMWVWTPREQPATSGLEGESVASIAVIPFQVLGEDASQTYFAEGITLDLITELSRISGLLIIAPGTVFYYRESGADDRAIAAELGVRYLIRGGVQRIGERIRINVRLLEAERGQALWAERFSGDTSRLFQIQDDVVAGIAGALSRRLALPHARLERTGATESIAAYDEFLRGRERYGRLTPEDNRMAQLHFERALALDPGFARARAGLALSWSRSAIDGWTDDPKGALSQAAGFAEGAASIDPSVPQIHFVRAQVELFRGDYEGAAAAATAAIELDPNYADAYALLAWILHYAGRPDQAEAALREALRRNPRASAPYREIAGEIYFATARYAEAAREFEAALERNPAHARARLWLAATLLKLGRDEDAAWEAQELLAINPEFSLSRLLLAFPLKDPDQREALTEALAGLGLPE
jgi:TolB-like protein/DNA-binding winged helix-turn-helix (wHTH) protein